MRIIFLGGPGSGKSTVGNRLAGDLKWEWISTGEMLRQSSEEWIKEKLKTGELFDDEMIMGLVSSRLSGGENVILDGFPRTLKQAELMIERGIKVDLIVELEVPEEVAAERMMLRGREQDTLEIIKERWAEYKFREAEIVAYLMGNGVKMLRIDGSGAPEEVYKEVVNQIYKEMK